MGREVRRVPANWEHPKRRDQFGRYDYQPLFDSDFETTARAWLDEAIAWDGGTHTDLVEDPALKDKYPFYWQWGASPPDPESYRPKWTDEERTHFQMYETVSEGTPVSPVFATEEELVQWLIGEGHSEHAAREFVGSGWAPTFVIYGGRMASGIEAHDLMPGKS